MKKVPGPDIIAELRGNELTRITDVCDKAWENVREWLASHPSGSDRQAAAQHQGTFRTSLHMLFKIPEPPVDVVQSLIDCCPDTLAWKDSNGWLPLHHACANGASGKVISAIVDAYPEGKIIQDKRSRTPLHFTFFRRDALQDKAAAAVEAMMKDGVNEDDNVGNSMPEIVALLSDSGAAELKDEGGMLPIHYASSYGTSEDVLNILVEIFPESISSQENKGRNPMHIAMVNAHRNSSPKVMSFLLDQEDPNDIDIVNMYDDDHHLPIHLLAMASKFPEERVEARENALECLQLYLDAKPEATADFLMAVQELPDYLQELAVINDHIQDILNNKIVRKFPTMILVLDFAFLMLAIAFFEIASLDYIDMLFTRDSDDPADPPKNWHLIIILIGGLYFLIREVIQMISLVNLGNVGSWFSDTANYLDLITLFCMFYFTTGMYLDYHTNEEWFRIGAAFAKGFFWLSVINFLKSTQVEFSVFVSGVIYIAQRLTAFLLALFVILFMFAMMFLLLFIDTPICDCNTENPDADKFPHCTFGDSMLRMYGMLMGEITNEMRYSTKSVAVFYFFLYSFVVMVVLSNLLVAIVTDSYAVIKDERAAVVFWSNRLDFVAEIANIKGVFCTLEGSPRNEEDVSNDPLFKAWESTTSLLNSDIYASYNVTFRSPEYWYYFLARVAAVFAILTWIIIGILSAGWLWPPQIREYLFHQKKTGVSRAELGEQLEEQISELTDEFNDFCLVFKGEVKVDHKIFLSIKSEVEAVQAEIMADLLQVKEIMCTLLEMNKDQQGKG